jgi:hypothetical protein
LLPTATRTPSAVANGRTLPESLASAIAGDCCGLISFGLAGGLSPDIPAGTCINDRLRDGQQREQLLARTAAARDFIGHALSSHFEPCRRDGLQKFALVGKVLVRCVATNAGAAGELTQRKLKTQLKCVPRPFFDLASIAFC